MPLTLANKDIILLPFDEAAKYIIDGDLAFYRGSSFWARWIQGVGRSSYSHVSMLGWEDGDYTQPFSDLMAYEMRTGGGHASIFVSHCESWSGKIDIYRISDTHVTYRWQEETHKQIGKMHILDRRYAVSLMRRFCRTGNYGWWHLATTYLVNAPVLRIFFHQPTDDEMEYGEHKPYCSEAVAFAVKKAFTDLVCNTPDSYTQPGALAASPLLHYMFTVTSPKKE